MKPLAAALLAAVLSQHMAVYRARHRPVAELARLAESALGPDGRVAVDTRTASLILDGSPAGVERALALLAQLDRRLRTVVIEHSLEELDELQAAGLRVEWSARAGPLWVGDLVAGAEPGLRGSLTRRERTRELRARLRVLEGEPGLLTTGSARPLPGSFGAELRAESGFEALPTLLQSGRVHLELRAFDGRFEGGGVRYTAASTALELTPGETVVVAETEEAAAGETLDLPYGASRHESRISRVLLLRVDVEP